MCELTRTVRSALLVAILGIGSAQAGTFTPSFTCTGSCNDIPTAGDVSFPSPSILETWGNVMNVTGIGLLPGDLSSDMYTWNNTIMPDPMIGLADWTLSITDVTTGDGQFTTGTIGNGDPLFMGFSDSGTLTFSPSGGTTPAVPEPSIWAMMLLGFVGVAFAFHRSRRKLATI